MEEQLNNSEKGIPVPGTGDGSITGYNNGQLGTSEKRKDQSHGKNEQTGAEEFIK